MDELVANFTLEDAPIEAQFELNEADNVDALFQINAYGNDKHFTYTQAIPSDTWVINHNLNKKPSITVVDSAGNVQIPDEAKVVDKNTVIVKFIAAFAGEAYLN